MRFSGIATTALQPGFLQTTSSLRTIVTVNVSEGSVSEDFKMMNHNLDKSLSTGSFRLFGVTVFHKKLECLGEEMSTSTESTSNRLSSYIENE